MADNHFADVSKKGTMSLNHALIVLDRLNTTERIDVARDNLVEAVRVVSAAAKYRIPQRPNTIYNYCGHYSTAEKCPTCGSAFVNESPNYCSNCGQTIDWS